MAKMITKLVLDSDFDIGDDTWTEVAWSRPLVNSGGAWSSGSPKRLTVPSGVALVRVTAQIVFMPATSYSYILINKNSSATPLVVTMHVADLPVYELSTGWIAVSATDYFMLSANNSTNKDLQGQNSSYGASWFQMEYIT